MLRKLGLVVAALVVVLFVVIVTRPDTFEVKRSTTIAAPPAIAYGLVADFHGWSQWSPWEHLDPNQARTFTGPASGTGAAYHWKGNKDVGEGNMTITQGTAPSKVVIDLEFITPFPSKSVTTFDFVPAGEGTTVTWTMAGQNTFMGKAMSLAMNMDKMIGPDFESGLGKLKAASEAALAAQQAAAQAAPPPAEAAPADADAGQ